MATSNTEICNLAISHLGVGDEIATLETENSEEAKACRRFYDTALQTTLRDFPWTFANKFGTLTLVETDPSDEWGYSYRYPSDCIRILRVLSGDRNDTRQSRVAYKIGRDADGTLIYTDTQNAEIEYTFHEEDPTRYPMDFVMAFSLRLAAYIAPRLTKGDQMGLGRRAFELYVREIRSAQASSVNEEQVDEPPDTEFIAERES